MNTMLLAITISCLHLLVSRHGRALMRPQEHRQGRLYCAEGHSPTPLVWVASRRPGITTGTCRVGVWVIGVKQACPVNADDAMEETLWHQPAHLVVSLRHMAISSSDESHRTS